MNEKRKLKREIKICRQTIEEIERKRSRSQSALVQAVLLQEEPDENDVEWFNKYTGEITACRNHMIELQKKYARFLGTPDFFSRKEIVEAALANKYTDLSQMFRQHYADKLNALGLAYQAWKPIKNFYNLLYASSSSRGLDFWKKATKYDPIGQSELNLGL